MPAPYTLIVQAVLDLVVATDPAAYDRPEDHTRLGPKIWSEVIRFPFAMAYELVEENEAAIYRQEVRTRTFTLATMFKGLSLEQVNDEVEKLRTQFEQNRQLGGIVDWAWIGSYSIFQPEPREHDQVYAVEYEILTTVADDQHVPAGA